MKSKVKELTGEWETVLDNQVGAIAYEENKGIAEIRVGGGDALRLTKEGFSSEQAVTVEAKNYNSSAAIIGVIK